MALNINIKIEKTKSNKFNASIGFVSTNGKGCSSLSLLKNDPLAAIDDAISPILVIAPNLTQKEIDNHYERYGYP
jgi:hypothetical protein